MASTGVGNVLVGIFTPAFSYSATLSYSSIVNETLEDLGLGEDECEFLKQDNDKIACVIKNNKFTLEYVEQTYKKNKALTEQLQRAAEALQAFHKKVEADDAIIEDLKSQLRTKSEEDDEHIAWKLKYEEEHTLRKVLQDKLEKLKFVVNSDILDNQENNKPKIPKLQLPMNGIPHPTGEQPTAPARVEHKTGLVTSPNEFRNGLVTSPREFRNGPRDTQFPHLQDANTQTIRYLVSPRDTSLLQNANGKRSINSSMSSLPSSMSSSSSSITEMMMTSPRGGKHHHSGMAGGETSPRSASSPSPRGLTTSPRGGGTALAGGALTGRDLRRHSMNFEENGPIRRHSTNADLNGRASPRSKSSSELSPNYFDLIQSFPDVHSIMPVVHSFSYANALDGQFTAKRRNTIANLKSRSEIQLDLSADSLSQCRLCNCDMFRVANAGWICVCGHTNIKHSVSFLKASPVPSPTVSPRKIG